MKKTVRLQNNTVAEIIPEYALPVEKWYGRVFATQCMEAPDEVVQGWVYTPETGEFSPPVFLPPEPTTEETLLELGADWEYRLCMIELGLN